MKIVFVHRILFTFIA